MAEPSENKIHDVAVIGGGGAGTMAFLRAVLNGDDSLLLSGDATTARKGRATWVAEVDNIPGMHGLKRPITSTTKSTLSWLQSQDWLRDRAAQISASVTKLEKQGDIFVLHHGKDGEGRSRARFVILATGVMDVQPQIGGSIEPIFPFANRGDILYCIRCDGHRTLGHDTAVIGNSESAIYIAAMLVERYGLKPPAILANGTDLQLGDEAEELRQAYGMALHTEAIQSVLGDKKTGLAGFEVQGGATVSVTRAFVSLGLICYNELLTGLDGQVTSSGRAVVDEQFESSVTGLFVVGDLVVDRKLQVYTAWDGAVDAADSINSRLRNERRKARIDQFRSQTGSG